MSGVILNPELFPYAHATNEVVALRTQVAELEREAKVSKGCIRGLSHENEALKDNLVRDGRMQEDARAMIRDLEAQLRTARETTT